MNLLLQEIHLWKTVCRKFLPINEHSKKKPDTRVYTEQETFKFFLIYV